MTNTCFGDVVVDEFQWLKNQSDPAVQKWAKQQNQYTEKYLRGVPQDFSSRLLELYANSDASYGEVVSRGGRIFASELSRLVTMPSLGRSAEAEEIVDTEKLLAADPMHEFIEPSPNGRDLAVSLMAAADEKCDILVFDLQQNMKVVDVIKMGYGDLAWAADSTGFFYSREPLPGERPADAQAFFCQVWYHTVGAAQETDRWEFGQGLPKIAEIELDFDDASGQCW